MDRATTQAEQCALDIQTDKLFQEGVYAILGADKACFFEDGSMFLDVQHGECLSDQVMTRHGYKRYEFKNAGAANTFSTVNHCLSSGLFLRERGAFYHVVIFDGWESVNGDQMAEHPRFIVVHDVTAAVLAANEAEEISDEDLEAAATVAGGRNA